MACEIARLCSVRIGARSESFLTATNHNTAMIMLTNPVLSTYISSRSSTCQFGIKGRVSFQAHDTSLRSRSISQHDQNMAFIIITHVPDIVYESDGQLARIYRLINLEVKCLRRITLPRLSTSAAISTRRRAWRRA